MNDDNGAGCGRKASRSIAGPGAPRFAGADFSAAFAPPENMSPLLPFSEASNAISNEVGEIFDGNVYGRTKI